VKLDRPSVLLGFRLGEVLRVRARRHRRRRRLLRVSSLSCLSWFCSARSLSVSSHGFVRSARSAQAALRRLWRRMFAKGESSASTTARRRLMAMLFG
jgi:hypothetical protein